MSHPRYEHLGAEGDRIELVDASITWVGVFTTRFGTKFGVHLQDTNGHRIHTWYSGGKWVPQLGQRVSLRGTINKLERGEGQYRGLATTHVTRSKVIAVSSHPNAPAAERPTINRTESATWTNSTLNPPSSPTWDPHKSPTPNRST